MKHEKIYEDGKPFISEENGIKWYMMACGHRQGNSPESSYGLCPNCEFMARLGTSIKIPYTDLLPKT